MRANSEHINTKIHAFLQQCQQTQNTIAEYQKKHAPFTSSDAGILVLLQQRQQDKQWELVLTQKSPFLNKHAGQVAFPGGKYDETDKNITATALRETEEEIGVSANNIQLIHALEPQMSRYNILVHSFIALLDSDTLHQPSCDEITDSFNVPVQHFIDNDARFQVVEQGIQAPCWDYDGFRIWGFTAGVIAHIIKHIFAVESIPIFDFRPVKT